MKNVGSIRSEDWRNRAALRVREVAELLGVQPATVRDLARKGKLPALRLGGIIVVPTRALRFQLGELDASAPIVPSQPAPTPRATSVRAARILGELRPRTEGKRGR